MKYNLTSIVITNYNGKELLKKCIPSVLEAISYSGRDHEVILVDDASSDDSVNFVKKEFSYVKIIPLKENVGFQKASNEGVKQAKNEVVILLNNDILMEKDVIDKFLFHFENESLFSVSAKLFLWDKKTYLAGKREGIFKNGHFFLKDVDEKSLSYTLFSTGGAGAFRKSKFLELGGFDPIYYPLYWEDIDICYRAWKRGYYSLYDPEILMYHKHRATITKILTDRKLKIITARNSYIFLWKNITDEKLFLEHLIFCPLLLFKDLILGESRFIKAFFLALLKFSEILKKRNIEKKNVKLKDREVLKIHKKLFTR